MLVNTVPRGGIEYNFKGQVLKQIPPESRVLELFLYLYFRAASQMLRAKRIRDQRTQPTHLTDQNVWKELY